MSGASLTVLTKWQQMKGVYDFICVISKKYLYRTGFSIWFRLVSAALGVVMGVLAGIVFTFVYGGLF